MSKHQGIIDLFREIFKNPTERPLFRFEIAMAAIIVLALGLASSKDLVRLVLQAIFKVQPNFEFERVLLIGVVTLGISLAGLFVLELIWAQKD